MAEPSADRVDVNASTKEVGGAGMAKRMGAHAFYCQPRHFGGHSSGIAFHHGVNTKPGEWPTTSIQSFGAPLAGPSPADFADEGCFYSMGIPPTRVDVLMPVTGLTFAEGWARRASTIFEGVAVPTISRAELISVKRAAGRPEDLLDATALEESAPE